MNTCSNSTPHKYQAEEPSHLFRAKDKVLYGSLASVIAFYAVLVGVVAKEYLSGVVLEVAIVLGVAIPFLSFPILCLYQGFTSRRFSSLAFCLGAAISGAFMIVPVLLYAIVVEA